MSVWPRVGLSYRHTQAEQRMSTMGSPSCTDSSVVTGIFHLHFVSTTIYHPGERADIGHSSGTMQSAEWLLCLSAVWSVLRMSKSLPAEMREKLRCLSNFCSQRQKERRDSFRMLMLKTSGWSVRRYEDDLLPSTIPIFSGMMTNIHTHTRKTKK